ncbi:MAG TPA: ABC transporter permease [Solirubrobacteraceae bacterium]|nr:ABC transporter permease [Solirubrobacteraceae bacterium]
MSVAAAPQLQYRRRSKGALVLHQLRYDSLAFLRNRQSRFFTLALPVVFLVIFCALFGNGTVHVAGGTIKESTYYVPGLVGFGLIQAAFSNLVISVTAQRDSGVLKRRRSTPEPAWVLITGRALTAVGTAVVIAVILMLIGSVAYGATPPGRTIPAIIVTITVGAVSFCALGYPLVTAINSSDSAQPVIQMVMLPLYFISGVFVPSSQIPHWLADIANVFPVSHLQKALLEAFNPHTVGAGFAWSDLFFIAVWGAAGLVIALRRFGWVPKTR